MLLQYGKFDDWLIIISRISNSKKKILNFYSIYHTLVENKLTYGTFICKISSRFL
jgi:hypothetical protein